MPLVSFCVKCFNQESYIGEAIDGAFAQNYRPLEIIISDDASTDKSRRVIFDSIRQHGVSLELKEDTTERSVYYWEKEDLSVCLILNKHNLGNCANWQALCERAHGELLIKADGDDISEPQRVERVVAAWLMAGPKCGVIYHNATKIDCSGQEVGDATSEVFERKMSLGAVMACSRECCTRFGGCPYPKAADDMVYHYRAQLLGLTETRINEKLVKYRIGSGESTVGASYFKTLSQTLHIICWAFQCNLADLEYAKSWLPLNEWQRLKAIKTDELERLQAELPLWESAKFCERWAAWRKRHPKIDFSSVFFVHCILLMFPPRMSRFILNLLMKVSHF